MNQVSRVIPAYVVEVDGGIWGWKVCRHWDEGPRIFFTKESAEWWATKNLVHTYRIVDRDVVA